MAFTYTSKLLLGRNPNGTSGLQGLRVCEALFELKEALKAVGWTVLRSGDGLSYFSGSDGITSGSSDTGAGNFGNPNAWFRIRQPSGGAGAYAGTREFTIQAVDMSSFRIKYSKTGVFTGGTSNATRTPSAADERVIVGAGTDASPSGGAGIPMVNSETHHAAVHFAIGGAAEGFSFAMMLRIHPTTTYLFFFDAMKVNTYPSADVDPYVMCLTGFPSPTEIFTNYKLGLGGAAWMAANVYSPALGGSGSLGAIHAQEVGSANPSSGLYQSMPTIWVHFDSANNHIKGASTLFMCNGAGINQGGLHAVSDKSGQNYIANGSLGQNYSFLLKWDSSVKIYR